MARKCSGTKKCDRAVPGLYTAAQGADRRRSQVLGADALKGTGAIVAKDHAVIAKLPLDSKNLEQRDVQVSQGHSIRLNALTCGLHVILSAKNQWANPRMVMHCADSHARHDQNHRVIQKA